MELWIDAGYVRAGYGWSFPASDELRVGIGSFWPRHHVKEPTVRLASDLRLAPLGYQGNWIPHKLRRSVEDGVFFAGDSAGHCLPLTAEGIRTAIYFGLACGRELRAVLEGTHTREQALARYGAFSDSHARKFAALLAVQRAVGQITPSHWVFNRYLAIAPPSFVKGGPPALHGRRARALAAAVPA
jgi:flavin-dependent dehydrogenase